MRFAVLIDTVHTILTILYLIYYTLCTVPTIPCSELSRVPGQVPHDQRALDLHLHVVLHQGSFGRLVSNYWVLLPYCVYNMGFIALLSIFLLYLVIALIQNMGYINSVWIVYTV